MTYKSSDMVKLASRGVAAVHDLTQAPSENKLLDVLFYLWNEGGKEHQATIEEITDGLAWNTTGWTDFSTHFQALVDRKYVVIVSTPKLPGWDVELSSGKIIHESVGPYDTLVQKYPLATEIRKVE